jgi:ABC-2 type transport system ATP-binding protein
MYAISTCSKSVSGRLPDGVTADQVPVLPGLDPGHDRLAAAHGRVEIGVADPVPALHALTGWAMERRLTLPDLAVSRPSIEDIYLQLTAGGAR